MIIRRAFVVIARDRRRARSEEIARIVVIVIVVIADVADIGSDRIFDEK